jgi:hypothetical protein
MIIKNNKRRKGLVDLPIVFVGLLILTIIALIVLTLFGFNLIDKIQNLVLGALSSVADFFASLFSLGAQV